MLRLRSVDVLAQVLLYVLVVLRLRGELETASLDHTWVDVPLAQDRQSPIAFPLSHDVVVALEHLLSRLLLCPVARVVQSLTLTVLVRLRDYREAIAEGTIKSGTIKKVAFLFAIREGISLPDRCWSPWMDWRKAKRRGLTYSK